MNSPSEWKTLLRLINLNIITAYIDLCHLLYSMSSQIAFKLSSHWGIGGPLRASLVSASSQTTVKAGSHQQVRLRSVFSQVQLLCLNFNRSVNTWSTCAPTSPRCRRRVSCRTSGAMSDTSWTFCSSVSTCCSFPVMLWSSSPCGVSGSASPNCVT